MFILVLSLLACASNSMFVSDCSPEPLGDQADLISALESAKAAPPVVDLDWNQHNEVGFEPVQLTLVLGGFTSLDADVCETGGEVWTSSVVDLEIEGSGWFPSMVAEATLSVRDGDPVIESVVYVPLDGYVGAANVLVEEEIGAEVPEEDMLTEARVELLVDEHVGEVGAEARFFQDQLIPLLPPCDTEECNDRPVQVNLAGTSHEL